MHNSLRGTHRSGPQTDVRSHLVSNLTWLSFNAPSPLKICSKPGQVVVYWDLYLFYMSQLSNGLREMSSTSFPKRSQYWRRMPSFWKHAWSKVVQWTVTMRSKLATLLCIHWARPSSFIELYSMLKHWSEGRSNCGGQVISVIVAAR